MKHTYDQHLTIIDQELDAVSARLCGAKAGERLGPVGASEGAVPQPVQAAYDRLHVLRFRSGPQVAHE